MEYKIVESRNSILLEETVNELIKKGWIPQGGVTKTHDHTLLQPMIRNK
jgi:hypothetical protein